jgi:hypothetical protein
MIGRFVNDHLTLPQFNETKRRKKEKDQLMPKTFFSLLCIEAPSPLLVVLL